jgi:hypothetical protein
MKSFKQHLNEGTWAVPDSKPKLQKLAKHLKTKNPATELNSRKFLISLYNLFGDDDFFDSVEKYINNPDPKVDLRDVLVQHLNKGWLKVKNYKITAAPRSWTTSMDDYDESANPSEGNVKRGKGNIKKVRGKMIRLTMSMEDIEEGTMRAGIFDPDVKKRKDAARKLVFFLKTKRNLKIGPADEKLDGSNKAIDGYIKELMKYVFDDEMIDNLYPTGKNEKQKANDVVVKRLKKMGVKVK